MCGVLPNVSSYINSDSITSMCAACDMHTATHTPDLLPCHLAGVPRWSAVRTQGHMARAVHMGGSATGHTL
jgi:hypothetical protein